MTSKKTLAESAIAGTNQTSLAPDLLEVWEVADYLNLTEGTVRRLIRDGVIPVVKLGGKKKSRIRVRRSDLDALIAANYRPATSGPLAERT